MLLSTLGAGARNADACGRCDIYRFAYAAAPIEFEGVLFWHGFRNALGIDVPTIVVVSESRQTTHTRLLFTTANSAGIVELGWSGAVHKQPWDTQTIQST